MIKVCFIFPSWSHEETLKIYSKMTPGRSGQWKDMVGVTDPFKADYCVIVDDALGVPYPKDRAIYMGAHPYIPGYDSYRCFDGMGVARLDLRDTFGFGEWWLKYDYDYLSKLQLQPMEKSKDLICIMSNAIGRPDQELRKLYIKRFCESHCLDLYGGLKPETEAIAAQYKGVLGNPDRAGVDYWYGKEGILENYRYALEFDNGPTKHYFSERIFDDILLYTTPILALGCTNLEEYLPEGSFHYANIAGYGNDVMEIIKRTPDYKALKEARDLLLNKYQLWARVWETIQNL